MNKAHTAHVQQVASFIREARGKLVVLTGAGLSTGSGIPDYRGPNGVYKRNKDYTPITFQKFTASHEFRQRYWARSFVGWQSIKDSKTNISHQSLDKLAKAGWVKAGIITQNVDGLLGKDNVLEMHGTLHEVGCLNCGHTVPRESFQQDLWNLNPSFHEKLSKPEKMTIGVREERPDGDVEIQWDYDKFQYPPCSSCHVGVYKPNVVFFGENMRQDVRDRSFQMIDDASHLLIVGSSLAVFSSFRLLKHAHSLGHRIAAVNLGEFRGRELVDLWIDDSSDHILPEVTKMLASEK
ncbi:NAD-dependent protein lipoamidase sirtuin-4 [Rhizoclosmatium sp. JEL0117]|nr:NAD-dependent protein lipoamidase sirtuin-4 [Rhizoclosmatium sp. JEL0117]